MVTIIRITVDTGMEIFSFSCSRSAWAVRHWRTVWYSWKKSHGREQKTGSLFQLDSTGSHHVPDDDGFSPDKKRYQCNSRNQPPFVSPVYGIHHGRQIFSVKNAVDGQGKNDRQEYSVKYDLFLLFISWHLLYICWSSSQFYFRPVHKYARSPFSVPA